MAKKKKNDYALLGNRLDLAFRNAQGQQTIGIPIGPDTSLVVAEVLASAIDTRLPDFVQDNGFRYIDDFECGFMGVSEAENALASIQNEFSKFELLLNPRKTRIAELPQPLETFWAPHLRLFPIGERSFLSQRTDLLNFFGRAFELAKDNREEAILKYAIQRMRSVRVHEDNWRMYEDLLLGCLSIESGTTQSVVSELLRYRESHPLDIARIRNAFERLIQYHAPQHHGSEVAWSIWFLAHASIPISAEATKLSLAIVDPVVTLCLLYARSVGMVPADVDWTSAEVLMTTEELQGQQWLLTYEAHIKGWLPSYGVADHLSASPQFDHLRNLGVTFFDPAAILSVIPVANLSVATDSSDFDVLENDDDDEGHNFADVSG